MDVQPGKYVAKVTDYSVATTLKGDPSIVIRFGFDGDKSLVWNGYLTEKTQEKTAEVLALLGLKEDDKIQDLIDGPPSCLLDLNKEVELVIAMETYEGKTRPRIQYVNQLGGASFRNVMEKDEFKIKIGGMDLKNKIKAARAKLGIRSKSEPAPSEELPF